jgi:transglutaminase-like putative cysteine protease
VDQRRAGGNLSTYKVKHSTLYEYETPVLHAHHWAHLRPRSCANQDVHLSEVEVRPGARSFTRNRDYFGNECDMIEVLTGHDCLEVVASSIVSVRPSAAAALAPEGTPAHEEVARGLKVQPELLSECEFCFDSPLVRTHPVLLDYALPIFTKKRPIVDAVLELNRRIHRDFKYDPSATEISTPLGQVMRQRRGVCQDFAHVAIGVLRSVGLAARYVSGYLETTPPPGRERLVGADASHAWASTFVPGFGWFDFDPTNDLVPSERHITVAWGRDFSDVSPLKGVVLGGGRHSLSVGVDVEPREPAVAPPRPA